MYVALGQSTSQIYFNSSSAADDGGAGWLARVDGDRDAELSLIEFGDQRPIQVEMRWSYVATRKRMILEQEQEWGREVV